MLSNTSVVMNNIIDYDDAVHRLCCGVVSNASVVMNYRIIEL